MKCSPSTLAVTFAGSVSSDGLPSQQISLLTEVLVPQKSVNDTGEASSTVIW